MADKKKTKFYFTNLAKNKDGKAKDGKITLKAEDGTHVWTKVADEGKGTANAPFYFRKVTGDFEAKVKVTATCKNWLDMCGILLQEKLGAYTKVALEYHDDPAAGPDGQPKGDHKYYAACYVHPKSLLGNYDNSTPYPGQYMRPDKKYDFVVLDKEKEEKVKIWLKVSKMGKFIDASYSMDGEDWTVLRQSEFTKAKTLSVGVFCASGSGGTDGCKATFEELSIEEDEDWEEGDDEESEEEEAGPVEDDDLEGVGNMALKAEEEMMARLAAMKAGFDGDGDAEKAQNEADGIKGLDLDAYNIPDVEDVPSAGGMADISEQMRKMEELRKSMEVPDEPEQI